ncbi:hypothetical protein WSM22_38530 [Cytophagales bacterium WSM2-2]|nr:hypothetical protein WSM22_38530 [Cytophagales bacterium WSM2-2]
MLNETKNYHVVLYDRNGEPQVPVGGVDWQVTLGDLIDNTNASASVKWTQYGTGFIEFGYQSFDDYYYGVAYTAVVVPDPNPTSTSITYYCNSTAYTLNSSPPTGVEWYWQTSIDGTSTSLGHSATITRTTTDPFYLRARALDGTWSANSLSFTTVTIVDWPTQGGSIGSSTTICSSTAPGTLTNTSSAQSGDGIVSYQWEQSLDNTNWSNVSSGGNSATYSPGSLSSKTYYRRKASAICGVAYSNVVIIDIYPTLSAGSISGPSTICYNTSPGTLNGTAATGANNYQWYSKTGINWFLISGATGQSYTPPGNFTGSHDYKRIAIGPCNSLSSDPITINVSPDLVPGSISGNQTICSGSSATALSESLPTGGDGSYSYQWQSSSDGSTLWSDISGATLPSYTSSFSTTTFLRRNESSCGQTRSYNSVNIIVDATSNGGTLNSSSSVFSSYSGSLALSGSTGSVVKWQSRVGAGNWTDLANTETSLLLLDVTKTTSYRVNVKSGICADTFSSEAQITIIPIPVITASTNRISLGPVTMDAGSGYSSYVWKNRAGATLGTARTYSTAVPDFYTVTVTQAGVIGTGLSAEFNLIDEMDGVQRNYVITNTVLKGGVTTSQGVKDLAVTDLSQSIQYFDGIGRPLQTVITQGSPSRKDIVQPVEYDVIGREAKKYLPYVSVEANGQFKANPTNDQAAFYTTGGKVASDTRPYSEITFEPSPLNRPTQQFGPGSDWKDNNKFVGHQYLVNSANEVLLFTYNQTTGLVSTGSGSSAGYYDAGQLHANVTTDEHGNEVIEYIDKLGHTVCKKVQYKTDSGMKQYASTYYVYDDIGNLVVVLPPEATTKLAQQQ